MTHSPYLYVKRAIFPICSKVSHSEDGSFIPEYEASSIRAVKDIKSKSLHASQHYFRWNGIFMAVHYKEVQIRSESIFFKL